MTLRLAQNLLSATEFASRRAAFAHALFPQSLAVVLSYPLRQYAHDINYLFRQQPDMEYLTGYTHPDAVAVIEKSSAKEDFSFHMFVNPPRYSAFDEPVPSFDEIKSIYGANEVHRLSELGDYATRVLPKIKRVYFPNHDNTFAQQLSNIKSFADFPEEKRSWTAFAHRLRLNKSSTEIAIMRKVASMAAVGFRRTMKLFGPRHWASGQNVPERLLGSTLEREFVAEGAQCHAYPPVVAGGPRGITVHYVSNAQQIQPGEMVLVDAGAYYGGYTSDITRTWPINGRFSQPQRELYETVLEIQLELIQGLQRKESKTITDVQIRYIELVVAGLKRLGFKDLTSTQMNAVAPHVVGHWLGMDTHDTDSITKQEKLMPGHIITVEPGLYIPNDPQFPQRYRGLAVRIEDDILITENGIENLTHEAPKLVEEIEECINTPIREEDYRFKIKL